HARAVREAEVRVGARGVLEVVRPGRRGGLVGRVAELDLAVGVQGEEVAVSRAAQLGVDPDVVVRAGGVRDQPQVAEGPGVRPGGGGTRVWASPFCSRVAYPGPSNGGRPASRQ